MSGSYLRYSQHFILFKRAGQNLVMSLTSHSKYTFFGTQQKCKSGLIYNNLNDCSVNISKTQDLESLTHIL